MATSTAVTLNHSYSGDFLSAVTVDLRKNTIRHARHAWLSDLDVRKPRGRKGGGTEFWTYPMICSSGP